jgi:uncharacterized protein (TIGR00725 family)
MSTRPVRITVVGGGSCDEKTAAAAERVGEEIARRGGVLICGGLGGVMEAAARGAKRAQGLTIGILPGERAEDANPHIDVPIATGLGEARNVVNVRAGDAVVAVKGRYGTSSEIALALGMGIPVVAFDSWAEVRDVVQAGSPEEAVATAFALAERRRDE